MFWRNQGFSRVFGRGLQRENNFNGPGRQIYNPQLNGATNPQLRQGQGFMGNGSMRQLGRVIPQPTQQQGQQMQQPLQQQEQFIQQPPQHQGQLMPQPPQFQGQNMLQPPQFQGQNMSQHPQFQGLTPQPAQQLTSAPVPQQSSFMPPSQLGLLGQHPQQQSRITPPALQQSQFIPQAAPQQGAFSGQPTLLPGQTQNRPIMPPEASALQQPPRIEPPLLPAAGQAPQSGNNPFPADMLKSAGTFMGYPEYTLGEPSMPSVPETTREASTKNTVFDGIRTLIQNERNSRDYYNSLSEAPINKFAKESLKSIAERADSRSRRLMDIYKATVGESFVPESKKIEKDIGYHDGLRLAIKEESRTLKSCAEIVENTPDLALKDRLNSIILEKLCQINELNLLTIE